MSKRNKRNKTVIHHSDNSKLDVSPGVDGGSFTLPKPDWASQDALIDVPPQVFTEKQRLVCTVCGPTERHGNTPPIDCSSDRLLSEVYHFSVTNHTKLTVALLNSPPRITIPFYSPISEDLNDLILKLLVRRDDEWITIDDALFDMDKNVVTCSTVPIGHFAVIGSRKEEHFDVTPRGCFYVSRLKHSVSVRVQKGAVSLNSVCSLRIVPFRLTKIHQARMDYPHELAEVPLVSDIYQFHLPIAVETAGAKGESADSSAPAEQSPEAAETDSAAFVPLYRQFKRDVTLKLPLPAGFNDKSYSPDRLALFCKLKDGDSWSCCARPLKVQGSAVITNVPLLAHFMVVLVRDVTRIPMMSSALLRFEEYLTTFRGELRTFMQYNKESKSWDISINWLNARDGKDRAMDSRMADLAERMMLNKWNVMQHADIRLASDEIPYKRFAWVATANNGATHSETVESGDAAANGTSPRRRQRKNVLVNDNLPKLPSVRNGTVINVSASYDLQSTSIGNGGTVSVALHEDLPDFAVCTIVHCVPSSDVEPRLRLYTQNLEMFFNNTLGKKPGQAIYYGDVRCVMVQPGVVTKKLVLASHRITLALEQLLEHFEIQLPQPPEPVLKSPALLPVNQTTSTPRPTSPSLPPLPTKPQITVEKHESNSLMQAVAELRNSTSLLPLPFAIRHTSAQKPAVQRSELVRPRVASNTMFLGKSEPKVLNGRSLQTLARHVDEAIELGMYLNLRTTMLGGMALDSMAKSSSHRSVEDFVYRLLLSWKRLRWDRLKVGKGAIVVEELALALREIGRLDLCIAVRRAHSLNTEFQLPE